MSDNLIECKYINSRKYRVCKKCIYDERVSGIKFDKNGICNYCQQIEDLKNKFGTGSKKGEIKFNQLKKDIKKSGKGKKYDCIVGVSGGTDSSYLIYLAKKWGLKPLALHYDNTWNTSKATTNIKRVLKKLDVDLYTYVVNNKEVDDIFKSFLLANVAEFDASTDLGFAYILRKVARKYSIKYILEGHSFLEEGITPLGRNYFDGKYIKSIHKKYGSLKMDTYPLMTFSKFLRSLIFDNVKFVRPFWYIKYSKKEAQQFLKRNFDWDYYGGHHLENRSAAFLHTVYLPQKFNTDLRNNTLSALTRNKYISREKALEIYNSEIKPDKNLINYLKKRLDLTDEKYNRIMNEPPKSWKDYPTYKNRFEMLRPLFFIMMKANLIPMSFYLKYCFPIEENS